MGPRTSVPAVAASAKEAQDHVEQSVPPDLITALHTLGASTADASTLRMHRHLGVPD